MTSAPAIPRSLTCNQFQGFRFSKPQLADELERDYLQREREKVPR